MEYKFITEIYNQIVPAGTWVYLYSRLMLYDKPCTTCEVWMKVDDEWAKATLTFENGVFWFWFRSRAGIYNIKFVGYKVRYMDREYLLESPTYKIVVRPKPFNLTPLTYEVKVFRKLTLKEVYNKIKYAKKLVVPNKKVYIVGGMARRGYSFNDVDIYIDPMPSMEERFKIQHLFRKITLLPVEIVIPKNMNKMVEVK